MQLELIIILFSYFTGIIISFYIGYQFGKREHITITYGGSEIERKQIEKEMKHQVIHFNNHPFETINDNDIKPGIVYRPTAEELEKMHEPQQVKEAKEAVAETLRQEVPPQV